MSEGEARGWPDLMRIVEERVRPERNKSLDSWSKDKAKRAELWWQFSRSAKDLYDAIRGLERVLVNCQVGPHLGFALLPASSVFAHTLNVYVFHHFSAFCTLQSRPHEVWARFFASSMKDDMRYTPSDCFETFPSPEGFETLPRLEERGHAYYDFRAALMIRNNEGLTKTYTRFHDPDERSPDIHNLRELHAEMDRAVLDAYGWTDLKPTCEFLLDYEEDDEDESGGGRRRKKPWRYRWLDDFRDEVLARLLELNRQRAEEERLSGAAAKAGRVKVRKKSTAGRKAARKNPDQPEFFES